MIEPNLDYTIATPLYLDVRTSPQFLNEALS